MLHISFNFCIKDSKAANDSGNLMKWEKVQSNPSKYLIDQSEEGIRRLVSCNLAIEKCCMYVYVVLW